MKIPFWNTEVSATDPAIWWNGELLQSHGDFATAIDRHRKTLASLTRQVVLLICGQGPDLPAWLSACLAEGHVVIPVDARLPIAEQQRLSDAYRVGITVAPVGDAHAVVSRHPETVELLPELALLLSTSGSTGNPRCVRLSTGNVLDNAGAIVESLGIDAADVGAAHLGMYYSYGLSVITSHLLAGASLAFSGGTLMEGVFWKAQRASGITHLPGTPVHYQFLERLGFERVVPKSVNTLTQAGGRLDPAIATQAHACMEVRGGRFNVMYGQTEAAPRMSVLTHADYTARPLSVGKPLAGGRFTIVDDTGQNLPAGQPGAVIYAGRNVMLGYAAGWQDLAAPDQQHQRLDTGDIGHLDEGGFLHLTGRGSREVKVGGLRVNLDDIERLVEPVGRYAAFEVDQRLIMVARDDAMAEPPESALPGLRQRLADVTTLPAAAVELAHVNPLPVNNRGKLDYPALRATLIDRRSSS